MEVYIENVHLSDIIVPNSYKRTPINKECLQKKRNYYLENNEPDLIILNYEYVLCGGYANYAIAAENKVDTVKCVILNFKWGDYKKVAKHIKNIICTDEQEFIDDAKEKSDKNIEEMENLYGSTLEKEWKGKITRKRKYSIYLKYNGKCMVCGNELMFLTDAPKRHYFTVDHYMPKCQGGENSSKNCIAMCERCNTLKDNILPDLFENQFKSAMAEGILENPEYQSMLLRKILKTKFIHLVSGIKAVFL